MGEGADSDAVSDIPIATVAKSIKITAGGVEGGKEVVDSYHATYDENTHTLSFNEDVEIQCSSTYTDRCFIATTGSPAPNIVIEINANVILTAPNIDGAFVAINSSSDVSIYGSGSLTIISPRANQETVEE